MTTQNSAVTHCDACRSLSQALRAPFQEHEVQWRTQKGVDVPYIDARTARDRLDEVFGPFGWQFSVHIVPGRRALPVGKKEMEAERQSPGSQVGGVIGQLTVRDPETGQWITRCDGADQPEIESFKGGVSDSFKRACAAFGVGAYLYDGAEAVRKLYRDLRNKKASTPDNGNGRPPVVNGHAVASPLLQKAREVFAPSSLGDATVAAGPSSGFSELRDAILKAGPEFSARETLRRCDSALEAKKVSMEEHTCLIHLVSLMIAKDETALLNAVQSAAAEANYSAALRDRVLQVAQQRARKMGVPLTLGV